MVASPIPYLFPFLLGDGTAEPPKVFGTGVLLKAGDCHLLLSAAHVFDQTSTDLYFTAGVDTAGHQSSHFTTDAPDGHRSLDRVDVGASKLPPEIAHQLIALGYLFLSVTDLDIEDVMTPGKRYSFTGFPGTRTRTLFVRRILRPQPIELMLNPISPERLAALGLPYQLNMGGEFIRENMAKPDGTRVTAPQPPGMSGGGVWVRSDDGGYRLVGIGTEWDERNGMLIGTRLGLLIAMIKNRCPETAPYLRDCSYLNVSLD